MLRLTFLLFYLLILPISYTYAQPTSIPASALTFLHQTQHRWKLTDTDLDDLVVSDRYVSSHNGTEHIYLQQRIAGIPVVNAVTGIHLDAQGNVVHAENRFWSQLSRRVNTSQETFSAGSALKQTAEALGLPMARIPILSRHRDAQPISYSDDQLSRMPIPIERVYLPMPDSSLRLAWQTGIYDPRNPDYWVTFVDAVTGEILDRFNRTIYCHFGPDSTQSDVCNDPTHETHRQERSFSLAGPSPIVSGDQAVYQVFPLPVESPIHGNQEMLINPADPLASPFGWHDTNGLPGPEFSITRGNNAFAYLDRNDDDASDGSEPDGGPELIFDYLYYDTIEPLDLPQTSMTQLFYTNNAMHDLAYHYGFTEAAGNFQTNNYGKGGKEQDAVLAQAQDGGGVNNANFLTLPDGDPGAMQMYFWTPSNAAYVQILSPAFLAGSRRTGTASFGPLISSKPTVGKVVPVIDSASTNLACSYILNTGQIRGNIALITRGSCPFKSKVLEAEKAGAIGVIIANNEDQLLTMGGNTTAPNPDIPAVLIRSSDAALILQEINRGNAVMASIAYQGQGPALRDGSFDNGVVAHEYAHGISNRLTGGPSRADCLFNDESMGEGWSDFFALATTVLPGQTGAEARGVVNYSVRLGVQGPGIRRKPYSTAFSINNQVYNDIIGTRPATATTRVPHPVGEIWAAALWDLYWALSDRYGWDPDTFRGKGGNNKAIQLVMDGMKLQPCNPGFIDGRDAILKADLINNQGANQCLIWEVFARRGLGWSADQGNINDRNDGIQAFDTPPACRENLVLEKKSTPLILPGERIDVELTLSNNKKNKTTHTVIEDPIPANATFVTGSAQGALQIDQKKGVLFFDLGELAPGESKTVRYQLRSDDALASSQRFKDDFETESVLWRAAALKGEAIWTRSTISAGDGSRSWNIPGSSKENHHTLELTEPLQISGSKPVLRFRHQYTTETTYDGGVVEVSLNGGVTWSPIPDSLIFRVPYARPLYNNAFGVATQKGFSGQSPPGFQASYADMRPYAGKPIRLRFRFATNEDAAGRGSSFLPGWYIDDVELFDAVNYASPACVLSDEGDMACTETAGWGAIVEPSVFTGIENDPPGTAIVKIFPNPASDWVAVQLGDLSLESMELLAADGRIVAHYDPASFAGNGPATIPIKSYPPGIYFLRVRSSKGSSVHKLVIGK
ncbi:MAG: M36 family metallopeptidase [Haliscomenobacter sp.]|nr:M36 family metallopeptidase [Haliscomenobacter sp.]